MVQEMGVFLWERQQSTWKGTKILETPPSKCLEPFCWLLQSRLLQRTVVVMVVIVVMAVMAAMVEVMVMMVALGSCWRHSLAK
jgi:hypothetical protein